MTLLGWVLGSCLCKTTWLSRNVAYPTHKWLSVLLQNNVKVKVTPRHSLASTVEKQSYSTNPLVTRHYTELGGHHHAPAALPPGNSGTHCIGGWVNLEVVLDGHSKSHPHLVSIPERTRCSKSLCRLRRSRRFPNNTLKTKQTRTLSRETWGCMYLGKYVQKPVGARR